MRGEFEDTEVVWGELQKHANPNNIGDAYNLLDRNCNTAVCLWKWWSFANQTGVITSAWEWLHHQRPMNLLED